MQKKKELSICHAFLFLVNLNLLISGWKEVFSLSTIDCSFEMKEWIKLLSHSIHFAEVENPMQRNWAIGMSSDHEMKII